MKRLTLAFVLLFASLAYGESFESMVGKTQVGPVAPGVTQVPYIFWGGDVATFIANGGTQTNANSIYGKAGLNLKLVSGDDFQAQVRDYLSGKSPYLRATLHMAALASEVMNKDPRTKPVMVLQLTWSLGDHIVVRPGIKTLNDLKGTKGCLQQGGPHIGLVDDSLTAAGLSWNDVEVIWAKDLTGTDNSPAAIFRKDPTVQWCCVVTPDMIGLCSGLTSTGSGAEGTVKGAHVVNSTAQMSRSILDAYFVRKDYFEANRPLVEKFVVGYLQATENLLAEKKAVQGGKFTPSYLQILKNAQTIWGNELLPTLEEDAHGLVSDANFARIPGNEAFFTDPNNLVGFVAKQKSALDLAKRLGYVSTAMGFEPVSWDYKSISERVGVKYVAPTFATGRIKAEVTDFDKDLENDTIFTFEVKFEPEQMTFPVESYASEFQRFAQASATFGNAAIVIEGHSDPTLALQYFYYAAKAKGLLTGNAGNYQFKGQPLDLSNTKLIIDAIQSENFSGQKRQDARGNLVDIPDPRTTVAAALSLSQGRAEAVKQAIDGYAKQNKLTLDLSQAIPKGVGIADPVFAKPKNMTEARANMRVVFRVVRVAAEAISEDDFNFDK